MKENKPLGDSETMIIEFKAVLILLLDLLEHGETERAIAKIRQILNSK